MSDASFAEAAETYRFLRSKNIDGIEGVYRIGRADAKQCIGILMMTHGNEPSGLAAASYVLSIDDLEQELRSANASVILCINNIDAADEYFATNGKGARYKEWNMNRLPEAIDSELTSRYSELKRAHDLISHVYPTFTCAIDLHSVPAGHAQMIIKVKGDVDGIIPHIPITSIITNICSVQRGSPISAFAGGKENTIPVIGIEAGQHDHADSSCAARQCAEGLLRSCGVLPSIEIEPREYDMYDVTHSVIPPDKNYRFSRLFETFEEVRSDTELLISTTGDRVLAGMDGCILIPRDPELLLDPTEEACFISRKRRIRTLP